MYFILKETSELHFKCNQIVLNQGTQGLLHLQMKNIMVSISTQHTEEGDASLTLSCGKSTLIKDRGTDPLFRRNWATLLTTGPNMSCMRTVHSFTSCRDMILWVAKQFHIHTATF